MGDAANVNLPRQTVSLLTNASAIPFDPIRSALSGLGGNYASAHDSNKPKRDRMCLMYNVGEAGEAHDVAMVDYH